MSYSSPHGMPPMCADAAGRFRSENKEPPTSGLQLSGQKATPTRIILDPEPANPYSALPRLLAITWSSALLPVLTVLFFRFRYRARQWNLAPISVAALLIAFACFIHFGRVSLSGSIALRLAMV